MNVRQTGRSRKVQRRVTVKHVPKAACLFFCIAGILTITLLRNETTKFREGKKQIMITAHRGASYKAPENTRASIELAIAEQADYVEIDVRMTADGVPVLMHDRALFRTTGVVNEIADVTFEEISSYDAGIRYAEEFEGEKVPGLQEILEEYGRKIKFNIELKDGKNPELVRIVVDLIEGYGLEERCAVTSDSYIQLETVKKCNGKIKTGYVLSRVYGEIYRCDAADFFSIKSEYITEQTVKGAHEKGKEIHAWTVNKAYELKRMRELGVDNIITDRPAYAKEIIQGSNI